nr:hypothetical protein [Actinomadura macra]
MARIASSTCAVSTAVVAPTGSGAAVAAATSGNTGTIWARPVSCSARRTGPASAGTTARSGQPSNCARVSVRARRTSPAASSSAESPKSTTTPLRRRPVVAGPEARDSARHTPSRMPA